MARGEIRSAREAFAQADSVLGASQFAGLVATDMPLMLPRDEADLIDAWVMAQAVDTMQITFDRLREFTDIPLIEFKRFGMGVVAALRGDEVNMNAFLDTLDTNDDRIVVSLAAQIRATHAYIGGEYEQAVSFSDSAIIEANWFDYGNPLISPVSPLMIKAQAYFAMDDHEQTVRWLNALGDGEISTAINPYLMVPNMAMSYYMRGKSYDALGENEKAIDFYTLFLKIWANADAEYQSYVQDARDNLDRLVIDRAREPQE